MMDEVRGVAERRWLVAAQLVVMLGLTAIVVPTISPPDAMNGTWLTKVLFLARLPALLAVATLFLGMRGVRWSDLGLRRIKPGRFILGFGLGLVGSVASSLAVKLWFSHAAGGHSDYSAFAPLHGDLMRLLFWGGLVSWTSAAFGEELLFRGFILDALRRLVGAERLLGLILVVLVQAVLFGLLHLYLGVGGAMTAGSIGFVFGLIWLLSGRNLWPGVILHGVLDASSMVAIYFVGVPHA